MSRRRLAAALLLGLAAAPAAALAGPERVAFPADYQTRFVQYNQVERPDRKPPVIRFFYANPEAFAAMAPGMASPEGTVLVMEDRKAALGPDGQPQLLELELAEPSLFLSHSAGAPARLAQAIAARLATA